MLGRSRQKPVSDKSQRLSSEQLYELLQENIYCPQNCFRDPIIF